VTESRTWVLVLSRRHALAAAADGQLMTSTGKRPALAQLAVGDRVLLYSPRTDHPDGEALRAVTAIGEVTGPEPVEAEAGRFRRAARLKVIEPVPLAEIREHLPLPLLRFGCVPLSDERGDAVWSIVRTWSKKRRRNPISKAERQAVIVSGPVGNDR